MLITPHSHWAPSRSGPTSRPLPTTTHPLIDYSLTSPLPPRLSPLPCIERTPSLAPPSTSLANSVRLISTNRHRLRLVFFRDRRSPAHRMCGCSFLFPSSGSNRRWWCGKVLAVRKLVLHWRDDILLIVSLC